jgi:hypothetical protein
MRRGLVRQRNRKKVTGALEMADFHQAGIGEAYKMSG